MQRRGMMVGSGKRGYYNVMGKDPIVHRQSAMGMKQPQRMPFYSINPAQAKYQPEKLAMGAVSEANEHRWATPQQATRIAKDHLLENPKYYGKYDEVGNIIAYEQGELNDKDTLKLFSRLIKNGRAWTLQGHYGRTAAALIDDGFIDRKGNLTQKSKTFIRQGLGGKLGGYDDKERAMWVENDEGLYNWRRSERKSVTAFVREHRKELDEIIDKQLGRTNGGKCGGKVSLKIDGTIHRFKLSNGLVVAVKEPRGLATQQKVDIWKKAVIKHFENRGTKAEYLGGNILKNATKGGKHLFTKIKSPKSNEELVGEISKSLKDKGYTFNIGVNKGHIELGNVRLGDEKVAKEGYNVSPYTGRRGRILNWGNWVEVNNTINDVLDKTNTSANVASLKGKFKIRQGTQKFTSYDWESKADENVGSIMQPVMRSDAWQSEGAPTRLRKR